MLNQFSSASLDKFSSPLTIHNMQAVLTVIIALIAAYIAYQQWRTNARMVKLDAFDRRFRIFDEVQRFIGVVLRNGGASEEELQKFYRATLEAEFIFGKEIPRYLSELRRHADKIWQDSKLVREANQGDPSLGADRVQWAAQHSVEIKWFRDQAAVIRRMFKGYLNLRRL